MGNIPECANIIKFQLRKLEQLKTFFTYEMKLWDMYT